MVARILLLEAGSRHCHTASCHLQTGIVRRHVVDRLAEACQAHEVNGLAGGINAHDTGKIITAVIMTNFRLDDLLVWHIAILLPLLLSFCAISGIAGDVLVEAHRWANRIPALMKSLYLHLLELVL